MKNNTSEKKCYNSWSCILSVAIIVFVLGSVVYDMVVSKPAMHRTINEIKVEVQEINEKIDAQSTIYYVADTTDANIAK